MAREAWLHVRMSEHERAAIAELAQRLNTSVASLARTLLTLPYEVLEDTADTAGSGFAVSPNDALIIFDAATMRRCERQIRAWGNHYNQAVRALNLIPAKRFMTEDKCLETIGYANARLERIAGASEDIAVSLEQIKNNACIQLDTRDGRAKGGV